MTNLPNLIQIKQIQITGETDYDLKQILQRQLRILQYEKQIEEFHTKIDDLNLLNKNKKERIKNKTK